MKQIEIETLKGLISNELNVELSEFWDDKKLACIDEWDSMGMLGIISLIDAEYGINLEANKLNNLEYVTDLIKYIISEIEK